MTDKHSAIELIVEAKKSLYEIGYTGELVLDDYQFADMFDDKVPVQRAELAAFAQAPPSYRNACIAIVAPKRLDPVEIQRYRALGAPQIFAVSEDAQRILRWKVFGDGVPELLETIRSDQFRSAIIQRREEWSPQTILRAKSISFAPDRPQLDFFDLGLLPALEEVTHKKLDELLRNVIARSKEIYTEFHNSDLDYQALFRLIFRLVAAKLLADRQYPGNWGGGAAQVIDNVGKFYFPNERPEDVLSDPRVQEAAWHRIQSGFHFQNLSVEALAYVYENTFVSQQTRRLLGTHATPHEVAEYILQQLPIEELALDERIVFEPFCGHAPFLVAGLGRLRNLLPPGTSAIDRHDYFVKMLSGIEIDSFAREIARYSLILADYPNPNGWQIDEGNAFEDGTIERHLAKCKIVLCNPPYEDFTADERTFNRSILSTNKAVETLRRVLLHPPEMFGFVLPRLFTSGRQYRDMWRKINSVYRDIHIVSLPDIAFTYSEAETVLLITHNRSNGVRRRRISHVDKPDFARFASSGRTTWSRDLPVEDDLIADTISLWHSPLLSAWSELAELPPLRTIADIHRGIEYNISLRGQHTALVSPIAKPGFKMGLDRVRGNLEPYFVRSKTFLNVDPTLMRGNAYLRPWQYPKVIVNAARLSRGPWIIAGAIDEGGIVCTQRFQGVWPKSDLPIEVIAAVINGPIANAFVGSFRSSRDNQVRVIGSIPVPKFTHEQIQRIISLARRYRDLRIGWIDDPFGALGIEPECRKILEQLDAVVLSAYDLPPRMEREILDYFAGHKRPGPVFFNRYYPDSFQAAIPWAQYISAEFAASSAKLTLERLPILHDQVMSDMVANLDV